ncbi:unnamed protein product [Effrenium voratum]|nr:unnamed protein product [Effrenium voratum]
MVVRLRCCRCLASAAERRVYDLLFKPGSEEVFYRTLHAFAARVDARAASNAFASLARLEARRLQLQAEPGQRPARGSARHAGSTLVFEDALSQRLQDALEQREELRPVQAVNLMWSLAKVAARDPFQALVTPIRDRVVAETPRLTGRDLSTVLWALAVLVADTPHKYLGQGHFPAYLSQRLRILADSRELSGVDLTQSVWAAAKLAECGLPDMGELFFSLAKCALGQTSSFECHSVSVSMWSIGLLEEYHNTAEVQALAKELAGAAVPLAPQMNSQMLANCAWGAARVRVDWEPFHQAMAEAGLHVWRTRGHAVLDQHIYNLVWSFCKAEVCSTGATRQLLLRAAEEARPCGRFERMASFHAAGLSWVMAKVFTSDVLAESKELTQDVPKDVQLALVCTMRRARREFETWRPKDLSWALWAGARAQLQDPAVTLLEPVMQQLASEEAQEVTAQDFGIVLWSMAALEVGRAAVPPQLLLRFLTRAKVKLQDVGPKEDALLANYAWACAKADLREPELIGLVLSKAREGFSHWESRGRVMVAWAQVAGCPATRQSWSFLKETYESGLDSLNEGRAENATAHAEQLASLRLALGYLPGYGLRLRPMPLHLHRQRGFEVTTSALQERVEGVLRNMGLASRMRSEIVTEGGLSVDTLLLPDTKRDEGQG